MAHIICFAIAFEQGDSIEFVSKFTNLTKGSLRYTTNMQDVRLMSETTANYFTKLLPYRKKVKVVCILGWHIIVHDLVKKRCTLAMYNKKVITFDSIETADKYKTDNKTSDYILEVVLNPIALLI